MHVAKFFSSCSVRSTAMTVQYRFSVGCYGWPPTSVLMPCGGQRAGKVIVDVQDEAAVTDAASSEPSPLRAVISTEERAHLRDSIARLPQNYRVPLVLRYYGELGYDEIAQQLGVQRNHVATLIFRAKQELRRKLARTRK
jgi:DNA-directed RNA polymerase specialized sigma24 family protein